MAGFGKKEYLPSLLAYDIDGLIYDSLKYNLSQKNNISSKINSLLIPFAQREMVASFMEGIDPDIKKLQIGYLAEIFEKYPEILLSNLRELKRLPPQRRKVIEKKLSKINSGIFKNYMDEYTKYIKESFIIPITSIVSILPKDELASMAEALVNLTSFKRRVSTSKETVGGPIDVAVISKGDGFIWIKRKHYFKPELNHHFFKNYFKEGELL